MALKLAVTDSAENRITSNDKFFGGDRSTPCRRKLQQKTLVYGNPGVFHMAIFEKNLFNTITKCQEKVYTFFWEIVIRL